MVIGNSLDLIFFLGLGPELRYTTDPGLLKSWEKKWDDHLKRFGSQRIALFSQILLITKKVSTLAASRVVGTE